jgi:hypothetical protein
MRLVVLRIMKNYSFYKDIVPFLNYQDVADRNNYHAAPNDWLVVVTDVMGSTKAIEAGRYQDVNVLGASSLMAVLNAVKGIEIPYVFGGDGGTILIPFESKNDVESALLASRDLAVSKFNLDLRIGLVPISHIRKLGADILVAKHQVGPAAAIAAFSGGGCALADMLVKKDKTYQVREVVNKYSGDFNGLQCRWDAFSSKNGEMVSLLISSNDKNSDIYKKCIIEINSIIGDSCNPITEEGLKSQITSKLLRTGNREVKVNTHNKSLLFRVKYQMKVIFEMLAFKFMLHKKIKGSEFDPERYLSEVPRATDSKKFDDTIRMVIDCSASQKAAIEHYLESRHKLGELNYGMTSSNEALMTCLIFNWNTHVHLVDGANGGYAAAAKQLKSQLNYSHGKTKAG